MCLRDSSMSEPSVPEPSVSEPQPQTLRVQYLGTSQSAFAPLVCLHGWGSNSDLWQALVERLGNEVQFMCIDLPGFGVNQHVVAPELNATLELLEQALPERCHLLGWSLGGMLAMSLVMRSQRTILSLTTIAANLKFASAADWPHACSRATFNDFEQGFRADAAGTYSRFTQLQSRGDSRAKEVCKRLRQCQSPPLAHQLPAWAASLRWLDQLDHRGCLAQLSSPLLAIFGKGDALVPEAAYDALRSEYCGMAEGIMIDGAGHVPHLSAPEKVAKALRSFLQRTDKPYHRDKCAIARAFSDAAERYDSIAHLQKKVANTLLEYLPEDRVQVCDLGCGTGFCIEPMVAAGRAVVAVDIAQGMLSMARKKMAQRHPSHTQAREKLAYVCADFESLPFPPAVFDCVVSSMSFQWSEDLAVLLPEVRKVLQAGGILLFATLGPDTLHELASAWSALDSYVHVNAFDSQARIIDQLQRAGFDVELCVREVETIDYANTWDLMRDLKGIGAHNVNAGKKNTITTRAQLRALAQAYERFRRASGLPASYEVIYIRARVN